MSTATFTFGIKVRNVTVNRQRSPMEAIDATGLAKSAFNDRVINGMPSGTEQQLEIHLVPFKENFSSFQELWDAVDKKGYKFADPMAFCALYENDQHTDDSMTMWFDKSEGKVGYLCVTTGSGFPGNSYISANHTETLWVSKHLLACVLK